MTSKQLTLVRRYTKTTGATASEAKKRRTAKKPAAKKPATRKTTTRKTTKRSKK